MAYRKTRPNLIYGKTEEEIKIIVCEQLDRLPAVSETMMWRLGVRTKEDRQAVASTIAKLVAHKEIIHFRASNKTYFATKPWLKRINACCESIVDPREKVLAG